MKKIVIFSFEVGVSNKKLTFIKIAIKGDFKVLKTGLSKNGQVSVK